MRTAAPTDRPDSRDTPRADESPTAIQVIGTVNFNSTFAGSLQRPVTPSTPEWRASHTHPRASSHAGNAALGEPAARHAIEQKQQPAESRLPPPTAEMDDAEAPVVAVAPQQVFCGPNQSAMDAIGLGALVGAHVTAPNELYQSAAQSAGPAGTAASTQQAPYPMTTDTRAVESTDSNPVSITAAQVLSFTCYYVCPRNSSMWAGALSSC